MRALMQIVYRSLNWIGLNIAFRKFQRSSRSVSQVINRRRAIPGPAILRWACLLYTSDAADERSSVDLGGRRIITKKKNKKNKNKKKKKKTVLDPHYTHTYSTLKTYNLSQIYQEVITQ